MIVSPRGVHSEIEAIDLSESAFELISRTLKDKTGICLYEGAERLVVSRLSRFLKPLNFTTFEEYLQYALSPPGVSELEQMINALTTNTTRFFRERGHFDILENQVMPRLVEKAKNGERIRIWSAACSSGEEVYSIAAIVLKCLPNAADYDFRILATDIDSNILEEAEAGLYRVSALEDVPPGYAEFIFDKDQSGEVLKVRPEARDLISFRYLNFMDPWPVSGPFDVIFCRNVTIYMDEETQMRILVGLENVLHTEGFLFIGHSERIGPSLSSRLELFGPTAFRRPTKIGLSSASAMEKKNVTSQYT